MTPPTDVRPEATAAKLRVLLVDDSSDFLKSLTRTLQHYPDVEVIGWALSGREAVAHVEESAPHLVLLDVAMPHMNGLDAARQIKQSARPPYVAMVTLYDIPEYRAAAAVAGADAYVVKWELDAQLPTLLKQARQAAFGGDC